MAKVIKKLNTKREITKKSKFNKVGEGVISHGLDALTGLASMFGLGSTAENLIRRFNKGLVPTAAEVEEVVLKIINKAKTEGNMQLDELRNKLNEIPLVKSSVQQGAIDKRISQLKAEIKKKNAEMSLADDMASIALDKANSINYASTGMKKEIADEAKTAAESAASYYNKVIQNSVEKEI